MSYDNNNPFARILRGELPCVKVAEDDATVAIMDLMPQADGHVLVLPREPAAEIFDLSPESAAACMRMTQRIAIAVRDALQPDGIFIGQFNGRAAGQTVAHVHFHVIPRWEGVALRLHAREIAESARSKRLHGASGNISCNGARPAEARFAVRACRAPAFRQSQQVTRVTARETRRAGPGATLDFELHRVVGRAD